MAKAIDFPNPASNGENVVVLYDTAFTAKKDRSLARILAHELAHLKYRNFSFNQKEEYEKISGWETKIDVTQERRPIYIIRRKSGFVEQDGKNSAEEDFCNNLEYFIFAPDRLKKETKPVFDWLNNRYGSKLRKEKK